MKPKLNRHEPNIGQPQTEALAGITASQNSGVLPFYDYKRDGKLAVGEAILFYKDGHREKVNKREVRNGK